MDPCVQDQVLTRWDVHLRRHFLVMDHDISGNCGTR